MTERTQYLKSFIIAIPVLSRGWRDIAEYPSYEEKEARDHLSNALDAHSEVRLITKITETYERR